MPLSASEPPAREMVHVRLNRELVREIDHLAVDWRMYRHEVMELLLRGGLKSLSEQQRMAV